MRTLNFQELNHISGGNKAICEECGLYEEDVKEKEDANAKAAGRMFSHVLGGLGSVVGGVYFGIPGSIILGSAGSELGAIIGEGSYRYDPGSLIHPDFKDPGYAWEEDE